MAKKAVKKKTAKKKVAKNSFKSWFLKGLWSITWKSALAFIAFMVIVGIYFDQKIERKLDGQTWNLPAQVYARPLVLSVGEHASKQRVINELKQLNYRAVKHVQGSGQFSVSGDKVNVYRRAFDFSDSMQYAKRFAIHFKNGQIKSINNAQRQGVKAIRFEPLLLARLHSKNIEDRLFVPFEKIPSLFIDTLLLMEDRDYYHHQGVSPLAILRAFITNMKAGHTVQGGSTLTQQLAKNMFLTRERSLWRKFQEAYIAVLLDHKYSKDRLLEAYLNELYLGQNGKSAIYGIGLASDFYFARPITELRVEQMALLVAIIKGPSYYNPRRNPKRAQERRDLVLRLMVENNLINRAEYQYAVRDNLGIADKHALNYRSNPAFISLLNRELAVQVPASVSKKSGLLIFTSIDPVSQRYAEKAVYNGIKRVSKKGQTNLQGSMVITDRTRAEVRAIVAGKNVKFSGFNRALDARRPIGSLVKPAVYLTALEKGYALDSVLKVAPISLKNSTGQRWRPKNYDRKYRGDVSLEYALVHSLNVPTVNLGMQVGLRNIINNLHAMGIKQKIKAYPSLVLGSVSLSPYQVAQMYQPMTMQGRYKRLSMIRSISSKEYDVLYQRSRTATRLFSKTSVEKLNVALHKVVTEGTSRSLRWRNPNQFLSGKTGTTNKLNDSWFVGFDNDEVVTTWVGRDDNKSAGLTGASGALVLFSYYMKHKGKK